MGLETRVARLEQTKDNAQGASILVTWQNPTGTFWKWDPETRGDVKLTAAEIASLGAPGTVSRSYGLDLSLV